MNLSYQNVLCPMGTWSSSIQYTAQTVYGGVANSPLYLQCPTVTYSSHVYYATGFTSDNEVLQPTKGTTPNDDEAWQLLI